MALLYSDTKSLSNGHLAFKKVVRICFANKDLYFRSRFSCLPMLTNKATIFLDDWLYRKVLARREGLLNQSKYSISCTNLFIKGKGNKK